MEIGALPLTPDAVVAYFAPWLRYKTGGARVQSVARDMGCTGVEVRALYLPKAQAVPEGKTDVGGGLTLVSDKRFECVSFTAVTASGTVTRSTAPPEDLLRDLHKQMRESGDRQVRAVEYVPLETGQRDSVTTVVYAV